MSRYDELHAAAVAAINEPCNNEHDQRVHDNLSHFDALRAKGHTGMCAAQQVYGGRPCSCPTLCDTCGKANVCCPVYPQHTVNCVEYSRRGE